MLVAEAVVAASRTVDTSIGLFPPPFFGGHTKTVLRLCGAWHINLSPLASLFSVLVASAMAFSSESCVASSLRYQVAELHFTLDEKNVAGLYSKTRNVFQVIQVHLYVNNILHEHGCKKSLMENFKVTQG